jgi:hypothetical protein
MKSICLLLFFSLYIVHGQKKDRIFRIESESKDDIGYSYRINILTLASNKTYDLVEQKFVSKKFARKNIISSYLQNKGVWNISNDTLKLIEDENKREIFFIIKKNYLIYLFDNIDKSSFRWNEFR